MSEKDTRNFIWITDLHLSDEPPGRRSDAYTDQIFTKLEQVRGLCHQHDAICLVGGDVFHVKNPKSSANSHSLIRRSIELFGAFPTGRVYGCVGNHDIRYDRLDTLPEQPLGVLAEAGVYKIIDGSVMFGDIQIDSYDYAESGLIYQRLKTSGERKGRHRFGIVHASACQGDSREFFGDTIIGYNQLADLDYDILMWGHDHTRVETQQSGNVVHINMGSLSRASLSEDETDRQISAVMISVTGEEITITELPLEVVPLAQAFRIEDKAITEIKESNGMKQFFSELSESVQGIQSSDPIEVLESLCKEDTALLAHVKEKCKL